MLVELLINECKHDIIVTLLVIKTFTFKKKAKTRNKAEGVVCQVLGQIHFISSPAIYLYLTPKASIFQSVK